MKYILFLPLLGAFACRPKATNENSIADTVKNQRIKVDSSAVQEAAAKTWLIKVIENKSAKSPFKSAPNTILISSP